MTVKANFLPRIGGLDTGGTIQDPDEIQKEVKNLVLYVYSQAIAMLLCRTELNPSISLHFNELEFDNWTDLTSQERSLSVFIIASYLLLENNINCIAYSISSLAEVKDPAEIFLRK